MAKNKTDEEIMFPDVKIGDIIIKPWSFGMLFELSTILERVLDKAEQKGLINELNNLKTSIPYTTLVKLFTIASPEILKIIEMTTKVDEERIKELPIDQGIILATTIYKQNSTAIATAIKNVLSVPPQKEEENEEEGAQQN